MKIINFLFKCKKKKKEPFTFWIFGHLYFLYCELLSHSVTNIFSQCVPCPSDIVFGTSTRETFLSFFFAFIICVYSTFKKIISLFLFW